MRVTRTLFIVLLLFCCHTVMGQSVASTSPAPTTVDPPAKENFHLYLLLGQSNMVGRDNRAMTMQVDNLRILALTPDGRWIVARDPVHTDEGKLKAGVGPGISFATEMLKVDPKVTIGLVPCAVGGSPLRRWVKGGDLYGKAVIRAKIAAQTGTIEGVLWHQGESDTANKEEADSYEAHLAQMFKDLRQDLGSPDLPIVVGQLGGFLSQSPASYPFVDTVRAAIKHMPAVLPHIGYANSDGLGDKGDKLHFSADAQRQMGVRYAQAMQPLQR